jgi:addiction module RelE/StbE family toxin
MRLNFSKRFEKQRSKLSQSLRRRLSERILLFSQEPFHETLHNHVLHGEYAGCRSINITGDYRAIFYHERVDIIRFIAIGTHHELFGS